MNSPDPFSSDTSDMWQQHICVSGTCIYEYTGQCRQTEETGVQSHDPALTRVKEMVTLLETKQVKGESEGLAGQAPTMGPCSKAAGHTKATETPFFLLPRCKRAAISHRPVNIHSIKLLFNPTPGLNRNEDESGGMYLGNWRHWPQFT